MAADHTSRFFDVEVLATHNDRRMQELRLSSHRRRNREIQEEPRCLRPRLAEPTVGALALSVFKQCASPSEERSHGPGKVEPAMLPPALVEDDGADVAPAHVQEKEADSVVARRIGARPKNRSTPPRCVMPSDAGEANAALENDSNGPTTQSEKQRSGNESVLAVEPLEGVDGDKKVETVDRWRSAEANKKGVCDLVRQPAAKGVDGDKKAETVDRWRNAKVAKKNVQLLADNVAGEGPVLNIAPQVGSSSAAGAVYCFSVTLDDPPMVAVVGDEKTAATLPLVGMTDAAGDATPILKADNSP